MNEEEIVANQKDIESNSFSTVVKSHYQRLITQVVDLISVVNSNYATGIYMIDREVHGYTKQHSSNADFIEFSVFETMPQDCAIADNFSLFIKLT